MKKTIIIFTTILLIGFIFCSIVGQAQLTIPTKQVITLAKVEYRPVKTISALSVSTPATDTVKYYTTFSDERILDYLEEKAVESNDTLYKFTPIYRIAVMKSRKLIIEQRVDIYVKTNVDMNRDEKLIYMLKKGKQLSVNNTNFWKFADSVMINNQ